MKDEMTTPQVPEPQPDDIVMGPWGVKHRGELTNPGYRCADLGCGCQVGTPTREAEK